MYELWFDPNDSIQEYCILESKTCRGTWVGLEYLPEKSNYLSHGVISDAVNPRIFGRCELIESFDTRGEALGYLKMQVLMEG